jgi:hypothetical protein
MLDHFQGIDGATPVSVRFIEKENKFEESQFKRMTGE